MKLNKLTNRIYFLGHDPEADRPILAYLKGDKFSLAIDAGYSASLKDQKEQSRDTGYIKVLKKEDVHFRKEYCGQDKLNIVLSDVAFSDKMTLDLGGITANIFHTVSPHSDDTACIYVPEERVLFLGDSTSEDFFNGGYMDKDKLQSLIQVIQATDCDCCILSHCEPLAKEDLLCYLKSVL